MLARRKLLGVGLAAAAGTGLVAATSAASAALPTLPLAPAAPRRVSFSNVHTGETLDTVYFAEGRYQADALHQVSHVLRDYRTGDVHFIDPVLLDVLVVLGQRTGTRKPFQVLSGYRSPKTNAMLHAHSEEVASHSLHMKGMAVDIHLADGPLAQLHDAALRLKGGGVGYYPESGFVHVDAGPVRHWQGT
ncbi:MAG: DUF882 domain-containing protein [Caulobacteraceae bacterium]|nr:DUF882 domain-containing protein [Caulobacteraceae bacterium]